MAKVEYIRCPRCELNYINKKDKLCKVCQMELQTKGTNSALDSEELELGICPICKTNYISEDETMCAQEKELEDERVGGIVDENENWRMYVDNEDEETEEDEVGDMSSVSDADDDMLAEDLGMTIDDEDEMEEEFEDDDYEDDLDDDLDDLDDDFDDDDLDDDDFDDED